MQEPDAGIDEQVWGVVGMLSDMRKGLSLSTGTLPPPSSEREWMLCLRWPLLWLVLDPGIVLSLQSLCYQEDDGCRRTHLMAVEGHT